MDYPVDAGMPLFYLLVRLLQGTAVGGICGNIGGGRAQLCQPVQFRLNGLVFFPPADPDDMGTIGTDQALGPCFADAACPAYHHVHAALLIQSLIVPALVERDQLLAMPHSPSMGIGVPLAVGWETEDFVHGKFSAGFQIYDPDLPRAIFLCHRPH